MFILALALLGAHARDYYVPPQPIPLEPTEQHRYDAATDPRPAATLDWLEGAECIGDGHTMLHMYFFAIGPDGASLEEIQIQITVSAGEVGPLEAHGGGLFSVPFTPPQVHTWTEVSFHAVGLSTDRAAIDSHFSQWVMPELRPIATAASSRAERLDRKERRRARAADRNQAPELPATVAKSARAPIRP